MTFTEKIEKSFDTLVLSDKGDCYCVWNELIYDRNVDDPDRDLIIETVNKILDLLNKSDKETQTKILNTEVSDLIEMVKS